MALEEVGPTRLGTTIRDKWVLERLIGVGGMASVYVARHKIGRLDAIKILHPEIARSPQIRARFEQEAHAVNSFRHPGVVEVRDVDVSEDGAPFMVMELLEGETLSDRFRRPPPLTPPEVLGYARDVLDVLGAAHERQIVHRDIKPDNLFLTADGRIKVLDFGIARVRSGMGRGMHTQAGVTLGTVAYMPPEQAKGLDIDGRADLYAVGATIFRILTGRIVHDAATDAELVMKAMSEPASRLSEVAPQIPADISAVVDRALSFDPAHRYPDAASMRGDVMAVLQGLPPPYARAAPPLPERAPSSFAFGGGAASAAVPPTLREAATVAPGVKGPSPAGIATRVGDAMAIAPTAAGPTTGPMVPATAPMGAMGPTTMPMGPPLGSNPPGVAGRARVQLGSNSPTMISGPGGARAVGSNERTLVSGPGALSEGRGDGSKRTRALLIAGGVVALVLLVVGGFVVASALRDGSGTPGSAASSSLHPPEAPSDPAALPVAATPAPAATPRAQATAAKPASPAPAPDPGGGQGKSSGKGKGKRDLGF